MRRLLKQLAPDLFVVAPIGEVVRREAAVVQAVHVGAEGEKAVDQRGVLEVNGQVEGSPPTALFLSVDVCAQLNQALHQWDVAIDRRQVETVVSWEEKIKVRSETGTAKLEQNHLCVCVCVEVVFFFQYIPL